MNDKILKTAYQRGFKRKKESLNLEICSALDTSTCTEAFFGDLNIFFGTYFKYF